MRTYRKLNQGAVDLGRSFAIGGTLRENANNKNLGDYFVDGKNKAAADKMTAEAELIGQKIQNRNSGRDLMLSGMTGLNGQQVTKMKDYQQNGIPMVEADGAVMPGMPQPQREDRPNWLTDEIQKSFNQALTGIAANDMSTGNTNPNQIAQAFSQFNDINKQNDIISGDLNANTVAQAYGATNAKPTVDVSGGVAFNPYGDINTINSQPYIQGKEIQAKATVDAAIKRAGVAGGQLPSEAKLINYYMQVLQFPKEKAIAMAQSKKNSPMQDVAMDAYLQTMQSLSLQPAPDDVTLEQWEQMKMKQAEESALQTVNFLKENQDLFNGGANADPFGLR